MIFQNMLKPCRKVIKVSHDPATLKLCKLYKLSKLELVLRGRTCNFGILLGRGWWRCRQGQLADEIKKNASTDIHRFDAFEILLFLSAYFSFSSTVTEYHLIRLNTLQTCEGLAWRFRAQVPYLRRQGKDPLLVHVRWKEMQLVSASETIFQAFEIAARKALGK